MKPVSMMDAANKRQEEFEQRRRTRLLGLAIDQAIQGIKNILVYGDIKWWHPDHKETCANIKSEANDALERLLSLERLLLHLADIYQSMVPVNQELRNRIDANSTPNKD